MRNKKIILIITIFIVVVMALVGCSPAKRPVPEDRNNLPLEQAPLPNTVPNQQGIDNTTERNRNSINQETTPRTTETVPRNMETVPRDSVDDITNQDLTTRANNIVDEVVKIQGIESATAIISENTAIVGVTMENNKEGNVTREIEERVKEIVKETDGKIDRVAVTADPDLFTRVENIAKDSGKGRPLSGLGREIEEIFRRITPTM